MVQKTINVIKGIFIIFSSLFVVFIAGSIFGSRNAEEFSSLTAQAKSKISYWLASAQAKEVMDMTNCYCGCGGGMKISECTCGHGEEMKKFINKEARRKSVDELMTAVAQKYGLKNIREESGRKKVKEFIVSKAGPNRPQIAIEPAGANLGDVKIFGGKVKTKFKVTNRGKEELVINKIETSCMCTEAQINYDGKKSPKFGMPGHNTKNPEDFSLTISGGKTAEVEVVFDPLAHGPDATGPVKRTVTIFSNDLVNLETEFEFEGNVIK
ncbi:MAG: DUF1573 domain-containing protein [Patescibacteria group bacterium]